MNWLEQLQAFREANPDLPEGVAVDETPVNDSKPRQRTRLDISIERKGRAGKTATLVTGWELPDDELREIAAQIKQKLGTGGSARGGDILIQGDRRAQVLSLLEEMGFKARII